MAATPESVSSFVKSCLEKGIGRSEIAAALEAGGWSVREAQTALEAFAESALPVPVPRKRASSSPRDAFLNLLSIAMLYKAVFATGAILFVLIDRWLPQPGEYAFFTLGILRWAAAALIVALPILAAVRIAIGRDIARNPLARMTPIYRFLAYLTLLIAALVMAGDLIAVIISFLAGDITARFVLKALVVLVLCGGVYLWYASDMRREESLGRQGAAGLAAGVPAAPAWRGWLSGAGAALAGLALVAALWLIGNPVLARQLFLDGRRVADLQRLQLSLENYHTRHDALPETLEQLRADPGTYVERTTDPVTGAAYGYTRIDPRTYELSATFDQPTPPDDARESWNRDLFFKHRAGVQTFTITVPRRDEKRPEQEPAPVPGRADR